MTLAKVGRRGSLVIPAAERRRAHIQQGDNVDVAAEGPGVLLIKKAPSLGDVQARLAGRLPEWSELEGRADKLLEKEAKTRSRQ